MFFRNFLDKIFFRFFFRLFYWENLEKIRKKFFENDTPQKNLDDFKSRMLNPLNLNCTLVEWSWSKTGLTTIFEKIWHDQEFFSPFPWGQTPFRIQSNNFHDNWTIQITCNFLHLSFSEFFPKKFFLWVTPFQLKLDQNLRRGLKISVISPTLVSQTNFLN